MELVYLWVEDYKNIKKQGFNFSSRFYCDYDDEKKNLIIKENDDYISDFFGKNINVTAIVGKNGSGKSSVLRAFGYSWNNVYYIFYKNGQLYSNHFQKDETLYSIQKKDIDTSDIIYLNKMFFMELDKGGLFNSLTLEKENLYKRLFQNNLDKEDNILDRHIFHKKILEIIFYGSLNRGYFQPTKIRISFNYFHRKFHKSNKLHDIYHNYRLKMMELSGRQDKTDENKIEEDALKKRLSGKAIYEVYFKSFKISKDSKEEEIIKFCRGDIDNILKTTYSKDDDYDVYFLNNFSESLDKFLNIFRDDNKIFDSKREYLIEDFKKDFFTENKDETINIFSYLYRIGFLEYDFYDDKRNSFSNLSSGEKSLFIDFNLIRKNIDKHIKYSSSHKENIELLIFIDEPDLTLHPEWQKSYIKSIISLLEPYKNIKFHFIVTTHSPFLLSDIPTQNIIFLDKDKNGNCKVVNGLKDKKQTFGANIHTLLSDSFFMKDGLMGEFAKDKINNVIELLKKRELSDKGLKHCEQIISIIGEPIVKNQLQRMLDSKKINYLTKDVKEEIEFLKHRIDVLRKRV